MVGERGFPYPYKQLGNAAPTYFSRSRDRALEFFFLGLSASSKMRFRLSATRRSSL